MKVRQMQDLDSLSASLGCFGIGRFGLREKAGGVGWESIGCTAEVARQRIADVETVLATDVRKSKDLSPNSSIASCSVCILACRVRCESSCLTQCYHSIRDSFRNHLGDDFSDVQSRNAFRAVARDATSSCDDFDNLSNSRVDKSRCRGIGHIGNRRRVVHRIVVRSWDSVRVRQIEGVCQIKHRVIEGWLRLLGWDSFHIV